MNKKVRVRFAPSPTGPLHIGGVRTALFNYLFAKRHGGDFILRIEDTDSKREVNGSVDYLTRSLTWLGFDFNEGFGIGGEHGPYVQSERKDIYKKHAEMLVDSGNAYYAFDTSEELAKMRADVEASGVKNTGYAGVIRERMKNSLHLSADEVERKLAAGDPYVIRFKMPRNKEVKFNDEVRGWVKFSAKDLDDKVIWKSSDGLPTYHLANIVDDHLMEISHVIRGEEWISSTPLHILLYDAFGWEHPTFAHLPLILGPDGKKLGKRNKYGIPVFIHDWTYKTTEGEFVDIKGFSNAGYEPDALFNFLVLLGWNPGGDIEIMTKDEMFSLFALDRVNKAGAMFDKKKLDSFNSTYVRGKDVSWILDKMNIPEGAIDGMSEDKLELIAKGATDRAIFASDLDGILDYVYKTPVIGDDFKVKNADEFVRVMNVFASDDFMFDFDENDWTPKNIKFELEQISAHIGVGVGKIMPMLRVAICGGASGPQLPEVMYVIGSKETKSRIDTLLNKLKELA